MGPDLVRMALAAGDGRGPCRSPRNSSAALDSARHRHRPGLGAALPRAARPTTPAFSSRPSPPTEPGPAPTCWPRHARTPGSPSGARARAGEAVPLLDEAVGDLRAARTRSGTSPASDRRNAHWGCPRPATAAAARVRMGEPDPHRAEGGEPRGRRAHQPTDRRAPVRLAAHGRDAHRARAPEARPRQPSRARRRRESAEASAGGASSSDSTRSSPSQPTKASSGSPGRLTRPAGGSIASSRMMITTRRSWQPSPTAASVI